MATDMDDRIRGEFEANRSQSNNPAENKRKNSKAGDFKISIDYDGFGASPVSDERLNSAPSQRTTDPQGRFRVSIPETESTKPQRPSSSAYYQSTRSNPSGAPASRPQATRPAAPTAKQPASRPASAQRPAIPARRPASASAASRQQPASGSAKRTQPARKPSPQTAQRNRRKKQEARKKNFFSFCVCLLVIVIITTITSSIALSAINDILAINKESTEAVSVVVPEGAGFNEAFKALADSGLIKQKLLCKLFCKFRNYDTYSYTDKKTGEKKKAKVEYEAGVYYFDTDEGLETMLESIKASRNVSKDTVRITFPEGWTVAQIFAKIEKYNVCTAEKLYANLEIVGKQFGFYENIEANSGRYLKAEGYLFPDTYDFYIGESANSVLKKMFANFESKWTKEFDEKLKESGMTKDQIIILASILQREAKDKTQMGDISSVIHNRLKSYPQLQLNSTKDYITSLNELGVFSEFYYSLYLESYNTYSFEGLPPGAICNPGIDAIEAALNPKNTNYYFFCHDKNGTIYLASTASEHAINTRKIFNESD